MLRSWGVILFLSISDFFGVRFFIRTRLSGMGAQVNLFQLPDRHMRINLCGGEIGMAQHRLSTCGLPSLCLVTKKLSAKAKKDPPWAFLDNASGGGLTPLFRLGVSHD